MANYSINGLLPGLNLSVDATTVAKTLNLIAYSSGDINYSKIASALKTYRKLKLEDKKDTDSLEKAMKSTGGFTKAETDVIKTITDKGESQSGEN